MKDTIEQNIISTIHPLENGVCIQASEKSALAESDHSFEQYYTIGKCLAKLLFKPHKNDYFPFTKDDKETG